MLLTGTCLVNYFPEYYSDLNRLIYLRILIDFKALPLILYKNLNKLSLDLDILAHKNENTNILTSVYVTPNLVSCIRMQVLQKPKKLNSAYQCT